VDYRILRKWVLPILILALVLAFLVLIPGVGIKVNGARRWLGIGAFRIQPSEVVKFAMIVFLASYVSVNYERIKTFKGLLPAALTLTFFTGLVAVETHISGAILIFSVGVIMLLIGGMGDGMSKVYEVYGSGSLKNLFLFFTFSAALLLCLGLMSRKKERLGLKEIAFGAMLGIPNFLSSLFLLNSLATVPAVIAFPTFSVAVILVVAIAGMLCFRERLNHRQLLGGFLICIALILLNL